PGRLGGEGGGAGGAPYPTAGVADSRGPAAGPSAVRGWWSRGGEGEGDRDEEQCCAGSVPSVGGGSLLLSCACAMQSASPSESGGGHDAGGDDQVAPDLLPGRFERAWLPNRQVGG